MPKNILVTGGSGFIGHHFVEHVLKNTNWNITVLDRLDCSCSQSRLVQVLYGNKSTLISSQLDKLELSLRLKFVWHDLKSEINSIVRKQLGEINRIYHFAASSHVDRSIKDPVSFVMDNVVGTTHLLNYAKHVYIYEAWKLDLFLNFGTDEIFGSVPSPYLSKENDPYRSSNAYAATKAGQEEMGIAFHNTHKLPVITTHTMNVFGERQHPEKFIPLCISKILKGEQICIHASPEGEPGIRSYIHARNVSDALLFLTEHGKVGEKYNIVGEKEVNNLDLAFCIAQILDKPLYYKLVDFHSSRPGHDLRYALDGTKLKNMGFQYPASFEDSLEKTIRWTLDHPEWLNI